MRMGLPGHNNGIPLPLSYLGWYVDSVKTDLQETGELEFKAKENKWFSIIQGEWTELSNVDTKEFSVQGIGNASNVTPPPVTYGCIDSEAMNYNPNAQIDDGSCTFCVYGCTTGSEIVGSQVNSNYNPLATCMDHSCIPCVYGCMDEASSNYNFQATCDSGTCVGCVYGCTDAEACNYNKEATCDDGSCLTVYGCTNELACNYNSLATCDDGSCLTIYGCTDNTTPNGCGIGCNGAINYSEIAECNDGSCKYCVYGCMNPAADNYDPLATCPSSIEEPYGCTYTISGCTDPEATNYDSRATIDDGSCIYAINGCMDDTAGAHPDVNGNDGNGAPACWPCEGYEATNFDPLASAMTTCNYDPKYDIYIPPGSVTVTSSNTITVGGLLTDLQCGSCGDQVTAVSAGGVETGFSGLLQWTNTGVSTWGSDLVFNFLYMGVIETLSLIHI